MTDHGFRRWARMVIFAVSAVYLQRAAWFIWPRWCGAAAAVYAGRLACVALRAR
jgi:hypothetical protein